jgi:DNA-binding NarL/FixJ family response regulator
MKPIRVLIVDDTPQVCHDLHTLLPLAGHIEIAGEAANGQAAIEQAAALRPDVVLMDLEMPIMDGCEAARQIKAGHPACRVIALTIHDGGAERQRAAQAGVDAFVVKGAPLETLLQAIQEREE